MKWSFTWSTRAIHLHSILVFLSQLKFWFAKKLKMNLRIAWQKRAFVNYQCGIQNSPRQSANAEAFAKAYLRFLVSASAKKNAEAIEWQWWCFSNKFKLVFMRQIIYYIIHIFLYSFSSLLLFSYFSFHETRYRKNTNPTLFTQVIKAQQNKWKKKLGVSECGHWIGSWAN